jgi:hypothetical protein
MLMQVGPLKARRTIQRRTNIGKEKTGASEQQGKEDHPNRDRERDEAMTNKTPKMRTGSGTRLQQAKHQK